MSEYRGRTYEVARENKGLARWRLRHWQTSHGGWWFYPSGMYFTEAGARRAAESWIRYKYPRERQRPGDGGLVWR